MTPEVQATMAAQHGLVTRPQLASLGYLPAEVQRLVRNGSLARVRPGVYAYPATVSEANGLPTTRQRLIDRAACLRIGRNFVRSHETAALELELPILLPPAAVTHVTRPNVGTRNLHGIKHHLAPYRPQDITQAHGFRVLAMARTAIDIARSSGSPYGEVAIDSARWRGVTVDDLQSTVDYMRFWPDRRRAVRALLGSSSGAESVGETLLRLLLQEIGIGPLETQFGLTDGRRTAWADLRAGRHLFEFDGAVKYGASADTAAAAVTAEKVRDDWFRGFHLGTSHAVWADVIGPGRTAAKERLAREYRQSVALWGTDVSDLERFRATARAYAV